MYQQIQYGHAPSQIPPFLPGALGHQTNCLSYCGKVKCFSGCPFPQSHAGLPASPHSTEGGYYHYRTSPRATDNGEVGLVLRSLEEESHNLVLNGLAPSTKVYASSRKAYLRFCSRLNLNPLPAAEHTLILYVAELHQFKAVSTIQTYLAGVRHFHIFSGYPDPLDKPKLQLALRGCKCIKPPRPCPRLPITPSIFR